MASNTPLILITNDDGVESPGLFALAEGLTDIAEVIVAAPLEQQSAAGASKPPQASCRIVTKSKTIRGQGMTFYGIEGSPVQAVQHGIMEIAPRRPDLVISGINYGENVGTTILASGTLGAAMEAAIMGIPALAISLQMPEEYHYIHADVDFSIAAHFACHFGAWALANRLPEGVDVLKIDVPQTATRETAWRTTHVSYHKRYMLMLPDRSDRAPPKLLRRGPADGAFEPDSDVQTVLRDRIVSVTPIRVNLTADVDLAELHTALMNGSPVKES